MRLWIAGGVAAFMLAGCSGILPRESSVDSTRFQTYDQLLAAYAKVDAGNTRLADLGTLGFDPRSTPNIEILSSVDVVARFLPTEAMTMKRLPPPVRTCIEAQEHCSAYVYRLQNSDERRSGTMVPDLLGFERNTVSSGWSAEIVLLMQDDRVVYKAMSSRPFIENRHDRSQPLGPIQDLNKLIDPPNQD